MEAANRPSFTFACDYACMAKKDKASRASKDEASREAELNTADGEKSTKLASMHNDTGKPKAKKSKGEKPKGKHEEGKPKKTGSKKGKSKKAAVKKAVDDELGGKVTSKKGAQKKGESGQGRKSKKDKKSEAKHASDKQAETGSQVTSSDGGKVSAKDLEVAARSLVAQLRAQPGFVLADSDANSTPGWSLGREAAEELMTATADELAQLQEMLYASERGVGGRSVLLVVQGMDTSGKGGIMRHVVGLLDPQGVELTAFKAPTKEEQEHPFLWRIRNALPKPGYVGVFDRSHYEDVLIVRVHDLVARSVWMRRYNQINQFEATTASKGTTIIKVLLHIDEQEQRQRLLERLDNPEKHYKFNPGDLVERKYWSEYQQAYQAVLDRTSTEVAPWFVVPANKKWYARLAVQQLLLAHLRELNLSFPEAEFDVAQQRELLLAEDA